MLQFTLVVVSVLTTGERVEVMHPMGPIAKETCDEAALAISKASVREVAFCTETEPPHRQ